MQPHEGVIYTYGAVIYNPSGGEIPHHLLVHEMTHMRQQNFNDEDAKKWWERYFLEPHFRIQQESEAYANQYSQICREIHDRNHQVRILYDLAGMLSGPIYGNVITHMGALKLIKKTHK